MEQDIYKQLKEARLARRLTQQHVSRWAEISQARVSRIESGSDDIRLSTLMRLADALDLEVMLVPKEAASLFRSSEVAREALRQLSGPFAPGAGQQRASRVEEDDENIWLKKYSDNDR